MRIFIGGIGGAGMAPLALVAHQAGYEVSGSDKQDSDYIAYLRKHGITNIAIGSPEQTSEILDESKPDWYVYSSALPKENPNHPELKRAEMLGVKTSKRDEFLNHIIEEKNLKLLAVAGTHGKTTTTAMLIWLLKELGLPIGYAVGAKLGFGDMGDLDQNAQYFVYECDEFDRNFISFKPAISLITGVAWDHPDIYPTRESYEQAFREFVAQSQQHILWQSDASKLGVSQSESTLVLNDNDPQLSKLKLVGMVNRRNAWQVIHVVSKITDKPLSELIEKLNAFPGLSRRFEQIVPGLYSDYAHTPEKIEGALQTAHEMADGNVVVVYEGLHNTRQHFIKEALAHLFDNVKRLYVVPSYLAREDPSLDMLEPKDLVNLLSKPELAKPAKLNSELRQTIQSHLDNKDLVLCLSAGGGDSLDEWLRREFTK